MTSGSEPGAVATRPKYGRHVGHVGGVGIDIGGVGGVGGVGIDIGGVGVGVGVGGVVTCAMVNGAAKAMTNVSASRRQLNLRNRLLF